MIKTHRSLGAREMMAMVALVVLFAVIVVLWVVSLPSRFAQIDQANQPANSFWRQLGEKAQEAMTWAENGAQEGQVQGAVVPKLDQSELSDEYLRMLEKKVIGS